MGSTKKIINREEAKIAKVIKLFHTFAFLAAWR